MLKFLSFHEGMIQYSITTEWIQINKGLKENVFQKDSTNYEKMKNIYLNKRDNYMENHSSSRERKYKRKYKRQR